jgi:hypothetical protein
MSDVPPSVHRTWKEEGMTRRRSGFLVLVALVGLLGMAIPVLAADGSVTITEADERYAFSPRRSM